MSYRVLDIEQVPAGVVATLSRSRALGKEPDLRDDFAALAAEPARIILLDL